MAAHPAIPFLWGHGSPVGVVTAPAGSIYVDRDTGNTYVQLPPGDNLEWQVLSFAGPPFENGQCFVYSVTGGELPTLGDFTLPLLLPQPSTHFAAIVTGAGTVDDLTYQVVLADNTLTTIHVKTSGLTTIGDKLLVTILSRND